MTRDELGVPEEGECESSDCEALELVLKWVVGNEEGVEESPDFSLDDEFVLCIGFLHVIIKLCIQ